MKVNPAFVIGPIKGLRLWALRGLAGGATAASGLIFVGLFFGAPWQRRIKTWLAFTAILAGWFALVTAWPSVAWAGQKWRVGRHINEIEKIAAPLRTDWPKVDGDTPDLGPFSAYPQGNPGALMLLTQPPPGATALPFNQIERTPDGGIAFQLTENEWGAWLEWHPDGKEPANFVGGLETRYTLLRSAPLRNGWYLTQYDARILE